mmetsp:Transcript_6445/g.27405  ORF Transcript_6445/g.27405 Transcript_6445/m.27405 type:complete len:608 (-) Transcript_6445:1536-3359(-)
MDRRWGILLLVLTLSSVPNGCSASIFGGGNGKGGPAVGGTPWSLQTDYVNLHEFGEAVLFADFDADYMVDILFVDKEVRKLSLGRWNHANYRFEPLGRGVELNFGNMNGLDSGDFNNDGILDIVVSTDDGKGHIFYNTMNSTGVFTAGPTLEPFSPGFLVLDADSDLVPDIFVTHPITGERGFHNNSPPGEFTYHKWEGYHPDCLIQEPSSNAHVDLDGDCHADLVLVSTCGLEVWSSPARVAPREVKMWSMSESDSEIYMVYDSSLYDPGTDGRILFADFNGDGCTDLVFPNHASRQFIMLSNVQKPRKYGAVCDLDPEWTLVRSVVMEDVTIAETQISTYFRIPASLRSGDFNMDGATDLIGIDGSTRELRLWRNSINVHDRNSTVSFERYDLLDLYQELGDIVAAASFDTDDSGRQDLVVIEGEGRTQLVWNGMKGGSNAMFFKTTGLSNLSYFTTPKPFAPVPGNTVSIVYDDEHGHEFRSCSQCPQSSYLPLQRCNCFFGLRRVVNYVSQMSVGAAGLTRTWSGLMPNSMALLWLDSGDGTGSWWMEYFLQRRGGQMLGITIVLSVLLVILGVVISIMSWRERVEDRREKAQNSELFGFADA